MECDYSLRQRQPFVILAIYIMTAALLGIAAPVQAAAGARAWVEMAPGGGSVVRVLAEAVSCPMLEVDGHGVPMATRAGPAVLTPRPNKANVAAGSAFPGLVCELALPSTTQRASLAGRPLPLPRHRIDRIVVIGDTGCRLKDADQAWQGCNDPAQWPFAAIAAQAAVLHPDLVLHVGDYLYRENPCPAGHRDCADTVWGYGEAGWRTDFLDPAAPLLAAAPWAMVRGNHEECSRAGQGWWRLLDPHPLLAMRDCLDPENDAAGNHTDPYTVTLGGGAQLIIADLIELAEGKPNDPGAVEAFGKDMALIASLARSAPDTFVTAHYPMNAVLWGKNGNGTVAIGSKPVSAFAPTQIAGVRAMLAGHIHFFQYASFADRPAQVIAGFSGTQEDPALAPASLAEAQGKLGAVPLSALTTIGGRFGFALLEREDHGWRLTAFALDGKIMDRFQL